VAIAEKDNFDAIAPSISPSLPDIVERLRLNDTSMEIGVFRPSQRCKMIAFSKISKILGG
jgi:hypothetical protein